MTGVYTNKAPGGVAYACSFRVTEAVYLVERMVDVLADRLGADQAALRMRNLLRPGQFPYKTQTGWEFDSGDYPRALRLAMDIAHYEDLRGARKARERGELMGIGVDFFTEGVGAGTRRRMDILGLGIANGAELRVHPTGKAVLRISVQTQGQGRDDVRPDRRRGTGHPARTSRWCTGTPTRPRSGSAPTGSRSTPVSGAAAAMVAGEVRERAKIWCRLRDARSEPGRPGVGEGRWYVTGDPDQGRTMTEIALAAHSNLELPEGVEGHLDATCVYNPPNLTFPFGAYICVVDVDADTGQVKVRRFIAVDDCGNRINPMIVEGQVHGGLADGLGMALMR